MAVQVMGRNGKAVTLLNPSEKGRKYAAELRADMHVANNHKIKRDKKGKPIRLSKAAKSYRAGYLDARKDSAKCWKAKQKKKSK